ncbi:MAG TPA: cytochrome b/b6 domain-containing protein [Burkholderiales bacterium]|nr:cytochrome b/b6 domain-containing protein [Burkholderiales bacterium]
MQSGETAVKVWDAPVRLFHWLLVLLFAFMFFSGKSGSDWIVWHMRAGYAVLALVLFRILWGFAGSTYARFSNFLAGPSACVDFARKLLARAPAPHAGHNPLGGWMVLALLLALLFQTSTGLFANDDLMSEGPLASLVSKAMSDRLSTLHSWNFNLLLLLAGLHVIAVLYHAGFMKENLIGAMFTGVKHLPANAAAGSAPARFASPWLALALLLVAAFAVYLIVKRPF